MVVYQTLVIEDLLLAPLLLRTLRLVRENPKLENEVVKLISSQQQKYSKAFGIHRQHHQQKSLFPWPAVFGKMHQHLAYSTMQSLRAKMNLCRSPEIATTKTKH